MSDNTVTIGYIPTSHLDLFWLGSYKSCLARGVDVIKQYVDRCLESPEETFLIETAVFAEEFLRRYPEYRDRLSALVSEGRVEVGAAYIDRLEHLPLGESHIRNLVLGKRWYREVFGAENELATHPDLPSFVPQVPQIYARAGVKYYVTSRKLFPDGAVWRFRAPDGSHMTVLNYPGHYVYHPMDSSELPPGVDGSRGAPVDVSASLKTFPLGTIPVAGSAGDLTDRETFRERYGRYLNELVADHRSKYPDMDFVYLTPSKVLVPYDDYAGLPELSGEVPSVWGIGIASIANGWNFFVEDRRNEARLITAEMLATLCQAKGASWLPPGAENWQGVFYERAFFDRKDPIKAGQEFSELWKMHVFVKDHNAGGEEGLLSEFQKRVRQDRCREYAGQVVETALASLTETSQDDPARVAVFNPHPYPWSGSVELEVPRELPVDELEFVDLGPDGAVNAPWQLEEVTRDSCRLHVRVLPVNGLGWKTLGLRQIGHAGASAGRSTELEVREEDDRVVMENQHVRLALGRESGNVLMVHDRSRDVDWAGNGVGEIYALRELGNDVRLELDGGPVPAEARWLAVTDIGPLFARCHVRKELLGCNVNQFYTVWADEPRVDCRLEIDWCGERDWHLRMGLPSPAKTEDVWYGSPFFGSRWSDIMREARPRNRDEVSPEIYNEYREVQGWLHLAGRRAGVTVLTLHPAFHFGERGLEALLLRTPQSCGDPRLYWEQTGRLHYEFSLILGDADWRRAGAARLGAVFLRPPVARLLGAVGSGFSDTPGRQSDSALGIELDHVELSALYATNAGRSLTARVWESAGSEANAALSGWLVEDREKIQVDLLDRSLDLAASPAGSPLRLSPWEIASHSLRIKD